MTVFGFPVGDAMFALVTAWAVSDMITAVAWEWMCSGRGK